jgi:hypothetical protein
MVFLRIIFTLQEKRAKHLLYLNNFSIIFLVSIRPDYPTPPQPQLNSPTTSKYRLLVRINGAVRFVERLLQMVSCCHSRSPDLLVGAGVLLDGIGPHPVHCRKWSVC